MTKKTYEHECFCPICQTVHTHTSEYSDPEEWGFIKDDDNKYFLQLCNDCLVLYTGLSI